MARRARCVAAPALLSAQGRGLDPAEILKPLADEWTTYNGDYSGKRYSALTQINRLTVKNLTLAWVAELTGGSLNGPAAAAAAAARRWRRRTDRRR